MIAPILPLIAVVNMSSLPNSTVAHWTAAVQRQVTEDLAPHWHMNAEVKFFPLGERPPDGAWLVRIYPGNKSMGQSGYHLNVDDGLPYADVFAIKGENTDLVLSHEILEMLTDPYDDRFVEDFPYMWFLEIADPVRMDSYVRDGVHLSNFVFPAWYNELSRAAKYDFMGIVDAPGSLRQGGYAIRVDSRSGRRTRLVAGG